MNRYLERDGEYYLLLDKGLQQCLEEEKKKHVELNKQRKSADRKRFWDTFSEKTGVSKSTINDWIKNGKKPHTSSPFWEFLRNTGWDESKIIRKVSIDEVSREKERRKELLHVNNTYDSQYEFCELPDIDDLLKQSEIESQPDDSIVDEDLSEKLRLHRRNEQERIYLLMREIGIGSLFLIKYIRNIYRIPTRSYIKDFIELFYLRKIRDPYFMEYVRDLLTDIHEKSKGDSKRALYDASTEYDVHQEICDMKYTYASDCYEVRYYANFEFIYKYLKYVNNYDITRRDLLKVIYGRKLPSSTMCSDLHELLKYLKERMVFERINPYVSQYEIEEYKSMKWEFDTSYVIKPIIAVRAHGSCAWRERLFQGNAIKHHFYNDSDKKYNHSIPLLNNTSYCKICDAIDQAQYMDYNAVVLYSRDLFECEEIRNMIEAYGKKNLVPVLYLRDVMLKSERCRDLK